MPRTKLDTQSYWEERLAAQTNLQGTGHRAFNLENNLWLYRAQRECLDLILEKNRVPITGQRVLDVGSGTGFFVDYYRQKQAGAITGVDLTQTSKNYLEKNFPGGVYFSADISESELPFSGPFDIVSVMGILYHIVEQDRFIQALHNVCRMIEQGGYLLISDSFHQPLLPAARHARLRALADYQPVLDQYAVKIIEIMPVYYLANRTLLPVIGPAVVNGLHLGRYFYRIDNRLRQTKLSNGAGLKTLLAQKVTPGS